MADNKIQDLLIGELLINRVEKRVSLELQRQKGSGKEIISDNEINNLIDEVMRVEIENPTKFSVHEWAKERSEQFTSNVTKIAYECLIEGFKKGIDNGR